MTKKKFVQQYLIGLLGIIGVYTLLHYVGVLSLLQKHYFLIVTTLCVVAFLTILIAAPVVGKSGEQFVGRFLILTTTQMLSIMSVILAVWYADKVHLKAVGLQMVSLFIIVLALQSILLIQSNNKQD